MLEKGNIIGGRCSSRTWDGFSFDVGADYFAKGMLKTLARLDKDIALRPVGFSVKSFNKGKVMTIPPGLHLIKRAFRIRDEQNGDCTIWSEDGG